MSKISTHLNESYDSLSKRQKKKIAPIMSGQVIQANIDGFTDVVTMQEAARFAGISDSTLYGFVKAGTIRRVHIPGRTYAIGLNLEDVRKLVVSLGTTIPLSDAAKELNVPYITAHGLVKQGRLAASKVDGTQRIRVTMESLAKEIEFRAGKTKQEIATAARMATLRDKNRPDLESVELLAKGLKKKLDERRNK